MSKHRNNLKPLQNPRNRIASQMMYKLHREDKISKPLELCCFRAFSEHHLTYIYRAASSPEAISIVRE